MTWERFLLAAEYYSVMFGVPGFIVAMFVLYVYFRDRHKRL